MKTYFTRASVIAVLMMCPVTFGEIIWDWGQEGSGGPGNTNVGVTVWGAFYPDDSNWGGGYVSCYTDQSDECTWSIGVYVYSYADGTLVGGSLQAMSGASASASGPRGTPYLSVSSYVSGTYSDEKDPPGVYDGDTEEFDAWEGVYAANYAYAEAHVTSGSSSQAQASAEASASCFMY